MLSELLVLFLSESEVRSLIDIEALIGAGHAPMTGLSELTHDVGSYELFSAV
jgi:hypothetical protein